MSQDQKDLFEGLRPRLLRACRGYLGTRGMEAEDIVEDARRLACGRLDSRAGLQGTGAWLLQYCRQLCGERLRCRSGIVRGMEASLERTRQELAVDKVESLNLGVQKQHWIWLLREAIKPMSLQGRQMLQLRNVKGLTYAQIAQTLDVSWPEVALRLDEAYQELLACIGPVRPHLDQDNLMRGPWGLSAAANV